VLCCALQGELEWLLALLNTLQVGLIMGVGIKAVGFIVDCFECTRVGLGGRVLLQRGIVRYVRCPIVLCVLCVMQEGKYLTVGRSERGKSQQDKAQIFADLASQANSRYVHDDVDRGGKCRIRQLDRV
jgi:hypothetical protein